METTPSVANVARNAGPRARGPRLVFPLVALALAWLSFSGQNAAAARSDALNQEQLALVESAGRAFAKKRYAAAAQLYRTAARKNPSDGPSLVMAGVASYLAGDSARAKSDLNAALQRRLEREDRELAAVYLDLVAEEAPAPEPSPWTGGIAARLGAGYDSNVLSAPPGSLAADTTTSTAAGSLFANLGVEGAIARGFDNGLDLELGYELAETAYHDRSRPNLDYQDHALTLGLDYAAESVLVSVAATGELSFGGVGFDLRAFDRSFRLTSDIVFGTGAVRLRAGGQWQVTETLDPEYSYFSGHRFEATVGPQIQLGGWRASFLARGRRDALGARSDAIDPSDPLCAGCTVTAVTPYSNKSIAALFRVTAPISWWLRPGLSARWEWRRYDEPVRTVETAAGALTARDENRRHDQRLAAGAHLAARLGSTFTLTARYDESLRTSSFEPMGSAPSPRSYRQRTFLLELGAELR